MNLAKILVLLKILLEVIPFFAGFTDPIANPFKRDRPSPKPRSQSLEGLARKVQRSVAKVQAQPWTFAINQDYRYRSAEGLKSSGLNRLLDVYFDHLGLLMTQKVEIYQSFLEVTHMLKPASSLFRPAIALQVLRHALKPS
jgi:hypothetical protein